MSEREVCVQCVFLINETNMEIDEEGHMDNTEDGREREREMGNRWCVSHMRLTQDMYVCFNIVTDSTQRKKLFFTEQIIPNNRNRVFVEKFKHFASIDEKEIFQSGEEIEEISERRNRDNYY